MNKNILITGGAGFIGSHLVNHFVKKYPNYNIILLDSLTYASDLSNVVKEYDHDNLTIQVGDIRDDYYLQTRIDKFDITDIIHLAAESHVDNSITDPNIFVQTNVIGTLNLLNVAKAAWGENSENRFHHVSTDEVYGDLTMDEKPFEETTPYDPSSPYSASKAASDHFVRAYARTYGMNVTISNCSNNYGPHQHKEKLIPVIINKLMNGENIPVYGKGENVRDWLWVGDHVTAIDEIFHNGRKGHTYNVGGDNEMSNIELVKRICTLYAEHTNGGVMPEEVNIPIEFVTDRKGHDFRYAINSNKLQTNLNWKPRSDMRDGLIETIKYYGGKEN